MALRHLSLVALVALFPLAGCGGKSGETATSIVSGKVTIEGKGPLTGGTIQFVPTAEPTKAVSSVIDATGSYAAIGVPHGECKVSIDNSSLRGQKPPPGIENMPGMASPGKYVVINAKYAKVESSGLSTKVERSTHTYDVELK